MYLSSLAEWLRRQTQNLWLPLVVSSSLGMVTSFLQSNDTPGFRLSIKETDKLQVRALVSTNFKENHQFRHCETGNFETSRFQCSELKLNAF